MILCLLAHDVGDDGHDDDYNDHDHDTDDDDRDDDMCGQVEVGSEQMMVLLYL